MRNWEDMCNKTELWISYNISFPNTDKGIISQGVIDGFKVPSVKKASELLYNKYYIMKMAMNFLFELVQSQVNKMIEIILSRVFSLLMSW